MPKAKKTEREEIDDRLAEISKERDKLNAEAEKLSNRRAALDATSAAAELVANLSPAVRDQLFQEIKAQGIDSGEAVGSPGT